MTAALTLASCAAPQPGREAAAARSFAFAAPRGCSLIQHEDGLRCFFVTTAGRTRAIRVSQQAAPFADMFPGEATRPARAALAEDPRSFWEMVVFLWEVVGPPEGAEVLRWDAGIRDRGLGPPGAEACLQFSLHSLITLPGAPPFAHDNEGVRCAAYDPATDIVEHFMLEYEEVRTPGVAPAPGFEDEAERVVRSLRLGASGT